jgi:hypothetical protein
MNKYPSRYSRHYSLLIRTLSKQSSPLALPSSPSIITCTIQELIKKLLRRSSHSCSEFKRLLWNLLCPVHILLRLLPNTHIVHLLSDDVHAVGESNPC